MNRKKVIYILVSIVTLFAVLLGCFFFLFNEKKSPQKGSRLISLVVNEQKLQFTSPGLTFEKIEEEKMNHTSYVDYKTTYDIVNRNQMTGTLHIVLRQIDNGDVWVFTRMNNHSKQTIDLEFNIPFENSNRYQFTDFDKIEVPHHDSEDVGYDPTTYPVGLIDLYQFEELRASIIVGKNFVSKQLETAYQNGGKSFVRELIKENEEFQIKSNVNSIQLTATLTSLGQDISEHWVLLSNAKLFKDHNQLMFWIERSNRKYRKTNAWYTEDGPYNKMVKTIEPLPESGLGYGRTLLLIQEEQALIEYKKTKERYFYDLIINSFANLETYKGEKNFWETEVTSTWLKNLYGLHAPYIDTRFNEKTALFVKEAGEILGIKGFEDALLNYADLLVIQEKSDNVIWIDEGYLISDFFSLNEAKQTHASLNHILGGLTILLESYLETGDKKYLETALMIQKGIEELGVTWLKENGDTWYKYNTNHTFEGEDYRELTLKDLLITKKLWEKTGYRMSPIFDTLIRSKTNYLVEAQLPISKEVIDLLHNQEYTELIEGYPNIIKY
ncbi:hypothetical protein [Bacillus solitudinis]|uniref:hypothetical protein n=1 Tax=Bacillus solitudinis TaxID=2014074 RepID=UPI000C24E5D4|nr:hypothetical protein [Bacillus solitudinis]